MWRLLLVLAAAVSSSLARAHAHAPASTEIAQAMGGLRWGMSKATVQRSVRGEILSGAHQDFLDRDLAVSAKESLLLSRDPISRTFHVFLAGKLRRLYVVFEPLAFPEGNFAAFVAKLRQRFGPGETHSAELTRGTGMMRHWVEWRDHSTRLRALDQTNHRGFYCLIFEALTH